MNAVELQIHKVLVGLRNVPTPDCLTLRII